MANQFVHWWAARMHFMHTIPEIFVDKVFLLARWCEELLKSANPIRRVNTRPKYKLNSTARKILCYNVLPIYILSISHRCDYFPIKYDQTCEVLAWTSMLSDYHTVGNCNFILCYEKRWYFVGVWNPTHPYNKVDTLAYCNFRIGFTFNASWVSSY